MRTRPFGVAGLLLLTLTLTACGSSGQSSTSSSSKAATSAATSAAGAKCDAVPGAQLVALQDDKKLQTVDNIIPAVNTKAAAQPLLTALNKVSAVLTTDKLVALNKQTDIERKTPANVAADFVKTEGLASGLSGGSGKLVIGAANFSENQTLANIYADVAKAAGYTASVKTVGNRELYLPALEKGEVQVVPEYVGTLTEFINKKVNGANATAQASGDLNATVAALTALGAKVGLKFGEPAQAADQNTFAVTKGFADKYLVTTLSDLASKCSSGLVLGGPPECPTRPFCKPGLESKYGLKFDSFTSLDAGGPLSKTALRTGKVNIALVFSSDAALAG
ncbi:MAG: glycine betaine ABC transporter substrate-binding protein [Actinomycetes bacterium]